MVIPRLPLDSAALEHVGVGLHRSTVDGADVPLVGRDVFAQFG